MKGIVNINPKINLLRNLSFWLNFIAKINKKAVIKDAPRY
jgi:hypothetical protein